MILQQVIWEKENCDYNVCHFNIIHISMSYLLINVKVTCGCEWIVA